MGKIKALSEEFVVTIFSENEVITEITNQCPSVENLYITDCGKMLHFKQVVETNQTIDVQSVRRYFSCIVSDVNKTLVGVTQVKIISPKFGGSDASDAIETALNKFLFKHRHTHEIIDIKYMQFGVAVTYRIRNEFDVIKNMALEESYQHEGKRIDVEYKGCKYSFNKSGIF